MELVSVGRSCHRGILQAVEISELPALGSGWAPTRGNR